MQIADINKLQFAEKLVFCRILMNDLEVLHAATLTHGIDQATEGAFKIAAIFAGESNASAHELTSGCDGYRHTTKWQVEDILEGQYGAVFIFAVIDIDGSHSILQIGGKNLDSAIHADVDWDIATIDLCDVGIGLDPFATTDIASRKSGWNMGNGEDHLIPFHTSPFLGLTTLSASYLLITRLISYEAFDMLTLLFYHRLLKISRGGHLP